MTEAVANVDFLSSIPEEVLAGSGHGRVYNLQLQSERAQEHLSHLRESLYRQIDREDRAAQAQGRIGSLTPAHERVENNPEVKAQTERVEELRVAVNAAQSEVGGIVFLPACDNLPEIQKRLTTLTKKAAKLGTEPITLKVTDEKLVLNYCYAEDPETHRGDYGDFEHVFCVLAGTTPKIPGFEFLATVTHTDQGNVIKRVPDRADTIDLAKYHSTGNLCEQCGLYRERLDTFIVYNEQTGETKQVGRNCLRDYTGINNPERVLKVLEQVWEFMRSLRSSRGQSPALLTTTFLTHCAAVMRSQGGYEKGLGHDAANNHYNFVNQIMTKDRPPQPLWVEPIEADEQAAAHILNWVRDWDESSEFATNVKISLASQVMNPKLYGYAGAAFVAYEKWMGRERAKKQSAERNATKGHIGTEGQRETFTLTVKSIKWIENRYATSQYDETKPLIIMEDQGGNEVKWFASSLPRVADSGAPMIDGTYQVKATVKRHEDDERWGKSTVITRAKFEKTINEPEESE